MTYNSVRAMLIAATAMMPIATSMAYAQDSDHSITLAVTEEPNNLDPCNISSGYIGGVIRKNIVESLTELDPETGEAIPMLAASWEQVSPETWRFTLREGVKFHDGEDLNAASVVTAVERMFNENLMCLDRNKFGDTVLTAEAVDEYTVDISGDPARAILPTLMIFFGISSPNQPVDAMSRAPIGTGPFRFVEWEAGNHIQVERFDDYWGEAPAVEEATYVFRSNSAVRAAMVDLGEADIGTAIAPQDATNPDLDKSFLNAETTRVRMIMMPPLDDRRVREALNLAIDRNALVGTVLHQDVIPATHFFLPSIVGYNHDLEVWPYEPDRAKELIAEAKAEGVPVEKELRLIGRIGFYNNQDLLMQTLEQMWEEVGMNIKLEMMETANWLELVNKPYADDRDAMFIMEMHDNVTGDAEATMMNRYSSAGRQTETNIPELDDLLNRARLALGDERDQLFGEANRIVHREVISAIPLFHMVENIRISPRLDFDPSNVQRSLLDLSEIGFKE